MWSVEVSVRWCSWFLCEFVSRGQIPPCAPKCLKVLWLSTRAEEQPLILLIISYFHCSRHKKKPQEMANKKKHLRLHKSQDQFKLMQVDEPGSPYVSSLPETPPPNHSLSESLKGSAGWMAHFITACHVQSNSSTRPILQPLQPLLTGFRGACKTVLPCRTRAGGCITKKSASNYSQARNCGWAVGAPLLPPSLTGYSHHGFGPDLGWAKDPQLTASQAKTPTHHLNPPS